MITNTSNYGVSRRPPAIHDQTRTSNIGARVEIMAIVGMPVGHVIWTISLPVCHIVSTCPQISPRFMVY
jgi:hypothetical protein